MICPGSGSKAHVAGNPAQVFECLPRAFPTAELLPFPLLKPRAKSHLGADFGRTPEEGFSHLCSRSGRVSLLI